MDLTSRIRDAAGGTPTWATVTRVTDPAGAPTFETFHLDDSATTVGFWPASVVKLYTAIASFELMNDLDLPADAILDFQHGETGRGWVSDCVRTPAEMCHNIFLESANEDYTLQLRWCGIDHLNTRFFTAANGFAHTALMRGYVHTRPHRYAPDEPQRVRVWGLPDPDGDGPAPLLHVREHTWSGTSYSAALGQTIIDERIANCSPTGDMAECMRRVMFHERLPEAERFDLTPAQLTLLREGAGGWVGMRNTSWTWAWTDSIHDVLPDACFYHKSGNISDYHLDLVYVSDAASDTHFIAAVATESPEKAPCQRIFKAIAAAMR